MKSLSKLLLLSLGGWWSMLCAVDALVAAAAETTTHRRISIVTGANGYVGREVVHALLKEDPSQSTSSCAIYCLVRPARMEAEAEYWKSHQSSSSSSSSSRVVHVRPYDMNDGGATVAEALDAAKIAENNAQSICVYHVASVFGPSDDPVQTAHDNVQGTEDLINAMAKAGNCRLVLTSSMAAVRGTGQDPLNGQFYTHKDWNSVSKLKADNWGSCYQWSKAESERRAWEHSKSLGVPMTSICPSFVFGPPSDTTTLSNSFSITLVDQWVHGKSPVQSRLCVDIRDVAQAHVAAGTRDAAIGRRFLVTTEARMSSEDTAEVLKNVCRETQLGNANAIHFDSQFQGGAIPIGQKEVESVERLEKYLGLTLRSVEETISDMGRSLLQAAAKEARKTKQ